MAEDIIGVFIGLASSQYEYIANITAPYRSEFSIELGNFLLIKDPPNSIVARVIDFVPQGELVSFMGQKWLSDVALNSDAIGSDIKKRKISYSVKIKILGSLDSQNVFKAGLRRIPHITSSVVKPSADVIRLIINQALKEEDSEKQKVIEIGTYYLDDNIKVNFNTGDLESKRTFIFARAGYGKSNLMKLIASNWKEGNGGLLIFDPDGEYALTDKKKRIGVMDKREAILLTNRKENQDINNILPTRELKFNFKEFEPRFILPIIIPPEKHETIFYSKLIGMDKENWNNLVDLFDEKGWKASFDEILTAVYGEEGAPDEDKSNMQPIKNNLVLPIKTLHNSNSMLMQIIEKALKKEQVIIFDVSLLGERVSLWMSSIIVRHIFDKNQQNFVNGSRENMIKATFVVDEAQQVLSKEHSDEAFVNLAKEGRKYTLGGVFITQQPATIPHEILSQADNFFVFHLLSRGDLDALQRANAHYSNDIITQLLNEPTKGKCFMWTSSQPFVLPIKIHLFEDEKAVNKAKEVQGQSTLLSSIIKEISEEFKSPVFNKILEKYTQVEEKYAGKEVKDKTIALFKMLDDDEKAYLRSKNAIQKSNDVEFAVTFSYYTNTLAVMGKVA